MKKFYEWLKDLFISHESQLASKLGAFDKIKADLLTMEDKITTKISTDQKEVEKLLAEIQISKGLAAKANTARVNISKLLGD